MEYIPNPPPTSSDEAQWVYEELRRLSDTLVKYRSQAFDIFHSPPPRPRLGMVAYADGVSWDPGAGEGAYEYRSDGNWYKLSTSSTGINLFTVVSVSSNYTAVYFNSVEADASSGLLLVTLPSPAVAGKDITVKKTDSTANIVRLVGTIDGDVNFDLLMEDEVVTVRSNGTDWTIV